MVNSSLEGQFMLYKLKQNYLNYLILYYMGPCLMFSDFKGSNIEKET